MSCYFAVTVSQHILLVADNRRRILGEYGQKPLPKPILLDDAKKLHRINSFFWITGVGLQGFLNQMINHFRTVFQAFRCPPQLPLATLLKLADAWRKPVATGYEAAQRDAIVLARAIGGSPVDPATIQADLCVAALSEEKTPVLIHYSSDQSFQPEILLGPGEFICPRWPNSEDLSWEHHLRQRLEFILGVIMETSPDDLQTKSLEIFPPLMAWLARAMPEQISGCGDLVIVCPQGFRWLLF